jgi:phospholipase C
MVDLPDVLRLPVHTPVREAGGQLAVRAGRERGASSAGVGSDPYFDQSGHNQASMLAGDNFIGANVGAVMHGPQWNSTAVFLTWDDCGCLYDHVPPAAGGGVRVPMVIISPYPKPVSTDSTSATFNSLLAFIEHTFGLAPLSVRDATAYDYRNSFSLTQQPLGPITMARTAIPAGEKRWLQLHPPPADDPT